MFPFARVLYPPGGDLQLDLVTYSPRTRPLPSRRFLIIYPSIVASADAFIAMADRNEVTAACIRYFWDAVWGSTEYPRRRTTWSIIRDHLNRNMHFSLRARLDWLERNMDEIEAFYETRDQAMYDLQSRELSTELLLQA